MSRSRHKIGPLVVVPRGPLPLSSATQAGLGLATEPQVVIRATTPAAAGVRTRGEPLACVLGDRFEHAEARLAADTAVGQHQALVEESGQCVQHRPLGVVTNRLECLERRAPGEHRLMREQRLFRVGEEVVTPVERRPQGVLPRGHAGQAALEVQQGSETLEELLWAHQP